MVSMWRGAYASRLFPGALGQGVFAAGRRVPVRNLGFAAIAAVSVSFLGGLVAAGRHDGTEENGDRLSNVIARPPKGGSS